MGFEITQKDEGGIGGIGKILSLWDLKCVPHVKSSVTSLSKILSLWDLKLPRLPLQVAQRQRKILSLWDLKRRGAFKVRSMDGVKFYPFGI